MNKKQSPGFFSGVTQGIPICLGYLSVSFGFGIMAVQAGLTPAEASLISLTNLTSAGQAAGVDVIRASGSLLEMALVQLTVNIRYALMALSLTQKLDSSFTLPRRMLAAFGITDEIFGVCAAQEGMLRPAFMYGITLISMLGWTAGTFLGAAAGTLLPEPVTAALGIVLYGMFIAIVMPAARKQRSILLAAVIAGLLSIGMTVLLPVLSAGTRVILCSVTAAALAALIFPREDEEEAV